MVVIADTSPLNYLILIGHAEVLASLFGVVVIPPAVFEELSRQGTPERVREFVHSKPDWLRVSAPVMGALVAAHEEGLDDGEREAIALAEAIGSGVLLLVDDEKGRAAAERRRIRVLGTLGVLDLAAAQRLIDLPAALDQLLRTNFHVARKLVDKLLDRDALRRRTI